MKKTNFWQFTLSKPLYILAQLAGTVEYTDCISAKG